MPPLGAHIAKQFPQYELIKNTITPGLQYSTGTFLNPDPIFDKITGEYRYPIKSVENWLRYMGINQKTFDVKKKWKSYLERKRTAIGRSFRKRQSKYETALSRDDIRDVLDDVKYNDPQLWNEIQDRIRSEAEKRYKEKAK